MSDYLFTILPFLLFLDDFFFNDKFLSKLELMHFMDPFGLTFVGPFCGSNNRAYSFISSHFTLVLLIKQEIYSTSTLFYPSISPFTCGWRKRCRVRDWRERCDTLFGWREERRKKRREIKGMYLSLWVHEPLLIIK